jgi:hypothetical protein
MITPAGVVKVLDFCLAAVAQDPASGSAKLSGTLTCNALVAEVTTEGASVLIYSRETPVTSPQPALDSRYRDADFTGVIPPKGRPLRRIRGPKRVCQY